jgi:hypothetical protein
MKKLSEGGFWSTLSAKVGVVVTLLSLVGGGIAWARDKDSKIERLELIVSVIRDDFREMKADIKELLKRK